MTNMNTIRAASKEITFSLEQVRRTGVPPYKWVAALQLVLPKMPLLADQS